MRFMRYLWAAPLLVLLTLQLAAQDPEYKLSINAAGVTLDAYVQDANGKPQIHLAQQDFEIYDNDVRQDISYFGAAETPRSILLAFDVTGVMESQAPFMVKSVNMFLANLREQDRISVGTISTELSVLVNFRNVEKGKPLDIRMPKQQMGSDIYYSLDNAARRITKEPGRKAIIALTDGRDTTMFNNTLKYGYVQPLSEDLQFPKFLTDARKRGVPYYIVALDTDPKYMGNFDYEYAYLKNPTGYMSSPQYANGKRTKTIAEDYLAGVRLRIEKLAEATGGRVVYPHSIEDVASLYQQIAAELGYSYSLGYSPKSPNDGKPHRIDVRVKGDGFKVTQSRSSYGDLDPTPNRK